MGQRQRVSLILANANNPDVIFFDEPSNGVDIITQQLLNSHILDLKRQNKNRYFSNTRY